MHCLCSDYISDGKIAYILYPMDGFLDRWIVSAAKKYGTTIVVITGMDWQNVFSPQISFSRCRYKQGTLKLSWFQRSFYNFLISMNAGYFTSCLETLLPRRTTYMPLSGFSTCTP